MFRSILCQLIQRRPKDERLIDLFSFAMNTGSDGQLTASIREVNELVDVCLGLPSVGRVILIIDGLDECDNEDFDAELMPKLYKLGQYPHIGLALFGREIITRKVQDQLSGLRCFHIGPSNHQDIDLVLTLELSNLVTKRRLPANLDVKDAAARLTRRADGMFLWARLMVSFLNYPTLTVSERLDAILEIDQPEGIEDMYQRIFHVIAQGGKPGLQLASRVFMWLMYGFQKLPIHELKEAVSPGVQNKEHGSEAFEIKEFCNNVITACGGFVEPDTHGQTHDISLLSTDEQGGKEAGTFCFRFIHVSVKQYFTEVLNHDTEFLQARQFHGIQLILPAAQANTRITTQCLKY